MLSSGELLLLIRSFWADWGLPPTPTCVALRAYLDGPGQRQIGSRVDPQVGVVWLRPLRGGRWYVDRAA